MTNEARIEELITEHRLAVGNGGTTVEWRCKAKKCGFGAPGSESAYAAEARHQADVIAAWKCRRAAELEQALHDLIDECSDWQPGLWPQHLGSLATARALLAQGAQ
jgi:hypothetical protein